MSRPFKPKKRKIDQVSATSKDGEKLPITDVSHEFPAKVMKLENERNVRLTFDSEASRQLYPSKQIAEIQELKETPRIELTDQGMAAEKKKVKSKKLKVKPFSLTEIQVFVVSCFVPRAARFSQPTCAEVHGCHIADRICVFILDGDATFEPDAEEMNLFQEVIHFETCASWVDRLLNVHLSKKEIQKTFVNRGIEPELYLEVNRAEKMPLTPATKTKLLLSPLQMAVYGFPLPGDHQYVPTRDSYREVTDESPFFALDCEMCMTVGGKSEVTRLSVVDEDENVVYDKIVKPKKRIINYFTKYSGITREMMAGPTTTLPIALRTLKKIFPPDAILCGQALHGDLKYMGVMHPYVVDTSVIYNLSGKLSVKPGLKRLSARFLNQEIQQGSRGHSSVEDAIATLRLVKLKAEKGLEFGDNVTWPVKYSLSGLQCNSMPLTKYLKIKNMNVKLFYDYVDYDCNKFVAVYSSGTKIIEVVKKCISSMEKVVCIVMTSQGLCYIHS
ncbi:RNA exonuclease 1 [Halotydeus destructor]|nr:RNA exonuclease 1 [Halotydeus destructor]